MNQAARRFPWGQKGVHARAEPGIEPMGLRCQREHAVWGGVAGCEGWLGGINRGLVSRLKKVISSLVCND